MRRNKILIVDDDETIALALLRELYQDNATTDVLLASSAENAQAVVREYDIDVMVTDFRLPGMSGLDLVCWVAAESARTRIIVMTAYDTASLEDRAYRLGCVRMVRKPFDLHRMCGLIRDSISDRSELGGSLTCLSPADVIQMLCLARKSTALRVGDSAASGMVYIQEGEVIHAVWEEETGEAALFKLLRATHGMFQTLPLPARPTQSITRGWQVLLIEGMRRADEASRSLAAGSAGRAAAGAAEPALRTGWARSAKTTSGSAWPVQAAAPEGGVGDVGRAPGDEPSARAADVLALIDSGFVLLRSRDFAGARAQWEAARRLAPENRMIELNLRKLDALQGASPEDSPEEP